MAAGATQAQKTRHAYNTLHRIQLELANAGVPTEYRKANRVEAAHLVYIEGGAASHVSGGFNIKFKWSNASNGETFGWPIIYLVHNGATTRYGLGEQAGDYEKGIAKLIEVFTATKPSTEPEPLIQGVCKDCGNGTLNNTLAPAFEIVEDSHACCLACGSEHLDIL